MFYLIDSWKLSPSPFLYSLKATPKFSQNKSSRLFSTSSSSSYSSSTGTTTPQKYPHDLWVVGCSLLGETVCRHYDKAYEFEKIHLVGETATIPNDNLYALKIVEVRLRCMRTEDDHGKSKNVLICIPPYPDQKFYLQEIENAIKLWAGPEVGGRLVYTSSIGVYGRGENAKLDGVIVNEETPVPYSCDVVPDPDLVT